jgi:hypothetical protein
MVTNFSQSAVPTASRQVARRIIKKPILFENWLQFNPKILTESPPPKYVGYTLPKLRKNGKFNEERVF